MRSFNTHNDINVLDSNIADAVLSRSVATTLAHRSSSLGSDDLSVGLGLGVSHIAGVGLAELTLWLGVGGGCTSGFALTVAGRRFLRAKERIAGSDGVKLFAERGTDGDSTGLLFPVEIR